ncbi:MFS transporter [Streptomyces sp. NPDC059255]|uniref:MFS transporter n=1 Tax=Streptomyces sp. NPDC059255 TaxID=3346793 RepID=UPI0036A39C76
MFDLFGPTSTTAMSVRQRWAALIMLSGALLVVVMDMTIVIMALPDLIRDLGPSPTEQLWIVDVYSLVLAGLLIPMSLFADRIGRKRVLLLGFVVFGTGSLVVLFASAPGHVIAIRALLGVGGAMVMPATLSLIRTIFRDPKERALALAVWASVSGLGAVIGPVVGGALMEQFGWSAAFLINIPFAVAALIAGIVLLPEAEDPHPGRWDVVATALSVLGMVLLVWGVKRLAEAEWTDLRGLGALLCAGILLALFVRRCLARPRPLLDVRLFARRPFAAGAITALTSMLGMSALLLLVATWLQISEGMSPLLAGVALLPMAAGSFLFAPLAPLLARWIGPRLVLTGGLGIAGAGMVLLFAAGNSLAYWQLAVVLVLVGASTGSLAIASALIMGSTPEAKAGHAAAIEESMYDLGNVLGIAILGSIAAAVYGQQINTDRFAADGVTGDLATMAADSPVGAMTVAEQTGATGLAQAATDAFGTALARTSLAGGMLLLAVTGLVFWLVPKSTDLATHGLPEHEEKDSHV